ncbi:hypothetical protein [Pontibacillus sp. HMF3514]|uniref:hypothetical protein n=1 Tax=Pontibacillus sp. HMF3514 TaxID=2692425 RepID=UPI0013200FF7|nr:hypothetical protein [Pontibacillus sp. HMF3514]QHE53816.1 hypothetical protein GS400_18130 [Pontibacillus sp. HMF3514]
MLAIQRVRDYDLETMKEFFGVRLEQLDDEKNLYDHGYYVEINRDRKGFFALEPVEEESVWLKSLYLQPGVDPGVVLSLFELVEAYAKEHDIHNIYVYSHQAGLDTLLQSQQYAPVTEGNIPDSLEDQPGEDGKWWCYRVEKS